MKLTVKERNLLNVALIHPSYTSGIYPFILMDQNTRIITISSATSVVVTAILFTIGLQTHVLSFTSHSPVMVQTTGSSSYVPATSQESAVIDVVTKAEPAVVSVIIKKDLPVVERINNRSPLDGFPFNIQVPQYEQNGTRLQEVGGGTAFFISSDGLLMSNKHVVSDEKAQYTVLLNDGRTLDAKVLARDAVNDIALLKVEGSNFPALTFAGKGNLKLGQGVVSIGNALAEFRNTVSVGVISGLERTITAGNKAGGNTEELHRIIQTDAAINEGNSGGPLLNMNGDVIGMNTAVATGAQNIGFAIPVDDLLRVTQSYEQYGRIVRPYLGIRYIPVTQALKDANKLSADYGVLISKGDTVEDLAVLPNSPASKAGILEGDIILEADGVKLQGDAGLNDIIQQKAPGDPIALKIWRNGKELTLTANLEEWKE